jgi:hypothetical protein
MEATKRKKKFSKLEQQQQNVRLRHRGQNAPKYQNGPGQTGFQTGPTGFQTGYQSGPTGYQAQSGYQQGPNVIKRFTQ